MNASRIGSSSSAAGACQRRGPVVGQVALDVVEVADDVERTVPGGRQLPAPLGRAAQLGQVVAPHVGGGQPLPAPPQVQRAASAPMHAEQHHVERVPVQVAEDLLRLRGLVVHLDAEADLQPGRETPAQVLDGGGDGVVVPLARAALGGVHVVVLGEREAAQSGGQGLLAVGHRIGLGVDRVAGVQVLVVKLHHRYPGAYITPSTTGGALQPNLQHQRAERAVSRGDGSAHVPGPDRAHGRRAHARRRVFHLPVQPGRPRTHHDRHPRPEPRPARYRAAEVRRGAYRHRAQGAAPHRGAGGQRKPVLPARSGTQGRGVRVVPGGAADARHHPHRRAGGAAPQEPALHAHGRAGVARGRRAAHQHHRERPPAARYQRAAERGRGVPARRRRGHVRRAGGVRWAGARAEPDPGPRGPVRLARHGQLPVRADAGELPRRRVRHRGAVGGDAGAGRRTAVRRGVADLLLPPAHPEGSGIHHRRRVDDRPGHDGAARRAAGGGRLPASLSGQSGRLRAREGQRRARRGHPPVAQPHRLRGRVARLPRAHRGGARVLSVATAAPVVGAGGRGGPGDRRRHLARRHPGPLADGAAGDCQRPAPAGAADAYRHPARRRPGPRLRTPHAGGGRPLPDPPRGAGRPRRGSRAPSRRAPARATAR